MMSDPVNGMRKTTHINDIYENNLHSHGLLLTVIGDDVLPRARTVINYFESSPPISVLAGS